MQTIEALTLIQLIILAIGAYSITRLIVTDDFPLFRNIRNWIKDRFPPDDYVMEKRPPERIPSDHWRRASNGVYIVEKGHWIGELISCPWCAGWWVSLAVWVSFILTPSWTIAILVPFALRAMVGGYANKIGGG
jgi:hypothetical protein